MREGSFPAKHILNPDNYHQSNFTDFRLNTALIPFYHYTSPKTHLLADGTAIPTTEPLPHSLPSPSPQRPVHASHPSDDLDRPQSIRRALCGDSGDIRSLCSILEDWKIHTIIQPTQSAEKRQLDHDSLCPDLVRVGHIGDSPEEQSVFQELLYLAAEVDCVENYQSRLSVGVVGS